MDIYNTALAQSASPMDCTAMTQITGVVLGGTKPDGASRSLVFKVGTGNWQKWTGTAWADVATQNLTDASVLSEGNTDTEISALPSDNLASFAGKSVSVAVAMKILVGATTMPSITVTIKGKTPQDVHTEIKESDEISIVSSGEVLVNYFVTDTTVSGGTLKIEVSCYSSNTWSTYVDITAFQPQMASKIKYRTTAAVTEIGVGSVKVNSVNAVYTVGT